MRAGFILLPLLLASCSWLSLPEMPSFSLSSLKPHKIDVPQGNLITPDMRDKVKEGMTRAQVRLALGTPLLADPFHANRWDYVYRLEQEGKLVDQQRLTLFFDGDRLVRIDDSGMPPLPASAVAPASAVSAVPAGR